MTAIPFFFTELLERLKATKTWVNYLPAIKIICKYNIIYTKINLKYPSMTKKNIYIYIDI